MVEVRNLTKSFGDNLVLDDISLDVKIGENAVVFGRSGTGKSVLLKCIVKLLIPEAGEIIVDGRSVYSLKEKDLNELRKEIGFLFQGSALYDSMTVKENLEFPLIRNKKEMSQKEREDKVHEVLKAVDLEHAINKMPAELSGGMKKRVGLARAIIREPEILLYDEPTTGLDPVTRTTVDELIEKLKRAVASGAATVGAKAEASVKVGSPAAEYDASLVEIARKAITAVLGPKGLLDPIVTPGGEDFHYFTKKVPGLRAAYLGLGCDAEPGLHHPDFHFDHAMMPKGVAILLKAAELSMA